MSSHQAAAACAARRRRSPTPEVTRMSRANRKRYTPRLEALECRTLPTTFVVDSLGDAGAPTAPTPDRGDLRYCLTQANDSPGEDLIVFEVEGTINLTKALP